MSNKAYKLCIAIPTFNREVQLTKTLNLLEKQSCQDFYVIISDNCSDYDINSIINHLKPDFSNRIIIKKNNNNIGMIGNIASLFEKCDSEWCWFLSDDDLPGERAVEVIIHDIEMYEDRGLSFIQYPHFIVKDVGIQRHTLVNNLNDYVLYCDKLRTCSSVGEVQGTVIYLANKVYNLSRMKEYIKYAFEYGNTGIPQIIPMIKALDDGEITALLSIEKIIDYSPGRFSWNVRSVALGMSTISYIPLKIEKELQRRLWYYIMIRYKFVVSEYKKEGKTDYEYLSILYQNMYRYILDKSDNDFYKELLVHSRNGDDMSFLEAYDLT